LIMLCDDDDLVTPEHLARMVTALDGFDLVHSDVEIVQYRMDAFGTARLPVARRLFAYETEPQAMRYFSTFVPSGCVYRRRLHEVLGDFDEGVSHYWDWDFYLRVSRQHCVRKLPMASVLYAFDPDGCNLSANHHGMRAALDRLCTKHGLGELPTSNFFKMLDEPVVQARAVPSEISWDGVAIGSRIARGAVTRVGGSAIIRAFGA